TNKKPTSKTVKVVPSQADGLKKPTEKVWVDNDKKLSPSEQKSVKDKVEELNKKDNQKPTVTVGDNGETTVVFPDGSQATIPGNELVQEKGQSAEPTPVAPHTQSKEITGTGEKGAKISVAFPGGKTATGQVDEHGKFKVGVPTGVSLTKDQEITVTQTETNKKPTSKTVKVVPSQADGLKKPTEKVWVDNDKKLSPSEQKSVKDKVEELNKKDNQKPTVTVGDNGETTVVFPDGSQATIPGNELVQEKGQSAEPTPVAPHTQSKEITGTGEKGAKISVAFPGGKTATGQVDEHGKFKVGVPTGVSLTKDQEITVT
ncbi:Ig-like domain-containing protein, partial [Lactobacillus iners]